MLEKIKSIIFFAGIDPSNYKRVTPKINRSNCTMVTVFATYAAILTAIVFILTFFIESTRKNRAVYGVGFIFSILLVITSASVAKKRDWIATLLVHISFSVFFIYGILIGTITDPSQKTVTFMVMLIFMPVLFIEKPIRLASNICFYVLLFIWLCYKYKDGGVLSTDVMDSIIFGILGIASGIVLSHMKIRSYVLEFKLQELSRSDCLTQMNNRNSYEIELDTIPKTCKRSLTCIYIDVNGLHELNNSKGHAFGDAMLKFVAEQIRVFLNGRYAYRIGGDEFIVFIPDADEIETRNNVASMIEVIENENYHIAVGFESRSSHHLDMDNLIKSAESKMYQNKKQFYKSYAREQRTRMQD